MAAGSGDETNRRRASRPVIVAAGFAAILAVVLIMYSNRDTSEDTTQDAGIGTTDPTGGLSSPPSTTAGGSAEQKVRDAIARVDAGAPLTITVLGDSTGDEPHEWVASLGKTLAADHDRTVRYHAWDVTTGSYSPAVTFGEGRSDSPVVLYNGSAPGQGPFYSQSNLPDLAPGPSDLIVVSHGHNFTDASSGGAKEAALITAAREQWANDPAVAVVLQNPRTVRAPEQAANIAAVEQTAVDLDCMVIDISSAFAAEPDLADLLLQDGVHPNEEGQALWSETVEQALELP